VELVIERVSIRVSKGGHTIPEDVIRRRYDKGLHNFVMYAAVADDWYIYDNSGSEYELLAKSVDNRIEITNFDLYKTITGK
jgi:predicted ABC-type ATPase